VFLVSAMHVKKLRLLTPGPTPLYPPAVRAMAGSDIHHRTEDFRSIYRRVLKNLAHFMGTAKDVVLFSASGTGAMEAAVSNLFSEGDKVLVVSAGKFGERWAALTRAFGLDVAVVEAPYGDAVSPEKVAEALGAEPNTQGVFVQATESSTGVVHDIGAMAEIIRKTQAIFVVDAITGLGTSHIDIDGWGLDVVVGGSQKALMIPPGLSFVAISEKAWARTQDEAGGSFYFNFRKYKEAGEAGESPFTPAISLLLGLDSTLAYIREIGPEKLIANAQFLACATRKAAEALSVQPFAKATPAGALTSICAPDGIDSGEIVKQFDDRFGSIIANGQGVMKGKIFRIAHLGYFDFSDLFGTMAGLEIILESLGHPIALGAGVQAVQQTYIEMYSNLEISD
jgi:aspartate aminotransferase-like enzyme